MLEQYEEVQKGSRGSDRPLGARQGGGYFSVGTGFDSSVNFQLFRLSPY
jgi:hypothetical protein